MSGHLYQLYSTTRLASRSYFPVDGPWDKHGYVLKSEPVECPQFSGQNFLNLVRGTGVKKINVDFSLKDRK